MAPNEDNYSINEKKNQVFVKNCFFGAYLVRLMLYNADIKYGGVIENPFKFYTGGTKNG